MTEEIIAIVSIALIILIAAIYIIKAKKSGVKCIGCPHAKTCQSAKACQSSNFDRQYSLAYVIVQASASQGDETALGYALIRHSLLAIS